MASAAASTSNNQIANDVANLQAASAGIRDDAQLRRVMHGQ